MHPAKLNGKYGMSHLPGFRVLNRHRLFEHQFPQPGNGRTPRSGLQGQISIVYMPFYGIGADIEGFGNLPVGLAFIDQL
jgi:hypothetical protein